MCVSVHVRGIGELRTTEEASLICLSILSFPQNELFLIVSGGCVCFVFGDLPEYMQMVPAGQIQACVAGFYYFKFI